MKYLLASILTIWGYAAFGQISLSDSKETIDSTRNGVEEAFFNNGKKRYEHYYVRGLLNGKSIYYYDNGNIEKEGQFYKGTKTGLFKFWYSDGKLASEINIVNGEFDLETAKYWDRNGRRITENEFKRKIKK